MQPWYDKLRIGFVDTESTGLSAKDTITEFALVSSDDTVRYQTLVCPEVLPGEMAVYVSGLTWDMLVNEPTWDIVQDRVSACLRACDVIVAYNASHDKKFVTRQLEAFGGDVPDVPWLDALEWARLFPSRTHSLTDKARAFEVLPDEGVAHRAMYDALVLRSVFSCISHKMPVSLDETLRETERLKKAREGNRW